MHAAVSRGPMESAARSFPRPRGGGVWEGGGKGQGGVITACLSSQMSSSRTSSFFHVAKGRRSFAVTTTHGGS